MKPIQLMERKPPVEFTVERKLQYIEALKATGRFYTSALRVGIDESTAVEHRRQDPEFKRLCDEAKQTWIDEVLVAEATRRAIEGVEEPIIGGRYKDEIITHVRRYSDGLLTFLARAARPEFRDGADAAAGGGSGSASIMFIPASAPETIDDWEAQYGEAAKGRTGRNE